MYLCTDKKKKAATHQDSCIFNDILENKPPFHNGKAI